MSAIQIVNSLLKREAGVTGAVANRIFPIQAPQAVTGPYLVTNLTSGSDTSLISSPGEYYRHRVAVDVNAEKAQSVIDLGDIILVALPRYIKAEVDIFKDVDVMFADVDFTQPNDNRTAFMRTLQFMVRWRR
jgi:hypothetical protein